MNLYRVDVLAMACVAAIALAGCSGETTPNTPQPTSAAPTTEGTVATTTFEPPIDAPDQFVELSSGTVIPRGGANVMFLKQFGIEDITLEEAKEKYKSNGLEAVVGKFEKDCYIFVRRISDADPKKIEVVVDKRFDGMADVLVRATGDNSEEAAELIALNRAACR